MIIMLTLDAPVLYDVFITNKGGRARQLYMLSFVI